MAFPAPFLLLLLLHLPWRAVSVSSGGAEIYLCDPTSPLWGCTKFDPPSPPNTNCVMQGKENRIMAWAQAPERSDHYTLRSGDGPEANDPTTYRPNEFMSVHLRVLKTGWKYRGLLLNAVDGTGTVVGEFYNPTEPGIPHPSCPWMLPTRTDEPAPAGMAMAACSVMVTVW